MGDIMKKIKTAVVIILMLFSFYLSDKITSLAINKNPIMEKSKENSKSLTVMSENAIIKENTIIPGINGKEIDQEASFFKMREFGAFNNTFLIYKDIKPNISLEDNKDKIIIKGNHKKREVSIIIEDEEYLKNYFYKKNIDVTIMAKIKTRFNDFEYINAENTKKSFDDLESILKKNKINKKICIINFSNIEACKEKDYYLVDATITVNNSNLINNKKEIQNGSIILINNNLSKENLNILLNQINYLDLKVVYLSQLIKE